MTPRLSDLSSDSDLVLRAEAALRQIRARNTNPHHHYQPDAEEIADYVAKEELLPPGYSLSQLNEERRTFAEMHVLDFLESKRLLDSMSLSGTPDGRKVYSVPQHVVEEYAYLFQEH